MKKDDVVDEAHERFKLSSEWESENRELYVEDIRFGRGEQWPEEIKSEREKAQRPCLTINRLPAFAAQVISDVRQNSPTIQIHPEDSESDPELANIFEGLIRSIENQSSASQAYDTALEHSVGGGIGAFRITTEYASDSTFEQEIKIRRIVNPLTVYFDPSAKEYDKSDGNFLFVTELLKKDEFSKRHPDVEITNWEYATGDTKDWIGKDEIRIAEYWRKIPYERRLLLLETGETVEFKDGMTINDGMLITQNGPIQITRERVATCKKVEYFLLGGDKVIKGPVEWPGKYFPVVPVYGPEEWLEGKPRYRSLFRYAKEPQRQYNYWQSAITEKIALSPKAPFIGTAENFEGYETLWSNANTENRAFLPYNPDPAAPGVAPQRQAPAMINQAEMIQSAQAIDDLKSTMGIFDASLGARSNETSGIAITARQRQGDNATFAWIDNLSRSIELAGKILVDLIPKIYDTQRIIRILGIDDEEDFVEINKQYYDPMTRTVGIFNDLSVGKFDVKVSSGPSYQTQRMEAAESMMQFIAAVPDAGRVSGDLIAKNMDWPGAEELAERLKKMLPPGLDEDAPPQQPDPMQEMQMQAARLRLQKLMQDLQLGQQELQSKSAETQIDTAKARAEVAGKMADAEGQNLDNAQKMLEIQAQHGGLQSIVQREVFRILQQIAG